MLNWNRKCSGVGVPIGDGSQDTIYTFLFVDDQVLITQEYEDMEFMVRKLLEEYEKWGLKMNLKKKLSTRVVAKFSSKLAYMCR